MKGIFLSVLLILLSIIPSYSKPSSISMPALAHKALSKNSSESSKAIEILRQAGPEGLQILFDTYANKINQGQKNTDWKYLTNALDSVSQQKDCFASRLYWYTDLEQAKVAAKTAQKPILSLRLLGKLNEEFSCANSRFFRTTLYANAEISEFLRENFILHWESVRPVPRVTIDFGDGRKIERTLTGNSIHYVLDYKGRVVDALPGLYGSKSFLTELKKSVELARFSINITNPGARQDFLQTRYVEHLKTTSEAWSADLAKLGEEPTKSIPAPASQSNNFPNALEASNIAIAKSSIETRTIKEITPLPQLPNTPLDSPVWEKIAELHLTEATLDQKSINLIKYHNPYGCKIPGLSSKELNQKELEKTVKNLEHSIAIDTIRNEYLFRSKIYEWLLRGRMGNLLMNEVETLNEKVYSELFLTPSSDPWLGLISPNTYTGLEKDGIHNNSPQ